MLHSGYSRKSIAANIAKLRREGVPGRQAIAIAYQHARDEHARLKPKSKLPAGLFFKLGTRGKNPTSVVPLDLVGNLAGLARQVLSNPAETTERQIAEGRRLFEKFTGLPATELHRIDKPKSGSVVLAVGYVDAIEYTTERHNGKRAEVQAYRHDFKASARPLLAASHDGRVLLIIGGDFRFTDRGITDFAT